MATRRNPGLDALRTFAIIGMMAAHTSRMIEFDVRPEWAYRVLLLEPVIPSLFMLMVGISLTFSFDRAREKSIGPRAWYLRQARRAAVLWLISMVFYILELGPRFPDFVLLSGILATIAYSILLTGALLVSRHAWVLGLGLAIGILVYVRLDGTPFFPLNIGAAPLLPLIPFTFAGALWGLARKRLPTAVFWIGLAGLALAAWLLHRFGLEPLFTKPFGRSDAARDLAAPWFIAGGERRVGYYNLRPSLALFCLCVHLGALSLLGLLARIRGNAAKRLQGLFILGRHSLEVYILHLTLLAILVVSFGNRPLKTGAQGTWVLAGVFALSWVWCLWREKRQVS